MSSHDGERRKSWHGLGPCIYRVCVLWNLYLTLLPRHLCITHGERTHESRELWRRCTSRFGKLTTHAHGMHVRCFNVHQVEGVATSPVTYSIASQIIHHLFPVPDDHFGAARGVRGSATAHVDMLKQKETVICTIGEETVLARGFDSPTTLYIYTSCPFARSDTAHPEDPLSARCSCGGLQVVSHIISSAHLTRLTEMEVVVLCVAERNQEANDVDESCTGSVWCSHAHVACSRTMLLSFPLRPGALTPS